MKMKEKLVREKEYEWVLPKEVRTGMNVDAKVIASSEMLKHIENEAVEQLTNVAMLPGVIEPVLAMPDAHWGYGLPMGAVGAFHAEDGIISSGLCGFDINCGINLIRTDLKYSELAPKLKEIIPNLFRNVPSGVGAKGRLRLGHEELDDVLRLGSGWAVENGYGVARDLQHTEEGGGMKGADPQKISPLAKKRGAQQLGTLGAGNHFLEIQRVGEVFDEKKAGEWGVHGPDQVLIMLHCGSRGLGHQVATDYLKIQEQAVKKYNIKIPDRQLACAPANSPEGRDFFAAMQAAVNFSFANRQVMTHWIRETFEQVMGRDWESMGMHTVYGICHNVIKLEEHKVAGKKQKVFVHRKGATRSFPGQPVLIAGSMGTSSYLLQGTQYAMEATFGSSAHGAGRAMSRHQALRQFDGRAIQTELESKGEVVKATSPRSLAEEAPKAYKDVDLVIESVHGADVSRKVARMFPIGVVKG